MARPKQIAILAGMALAGVDVADGAMAVLIIVPAHEAAGPFSGGVAIGKSPGGEVGPVFGGTEQHLGEGIVVTKLRIPGVTGQFLLIRLERRDH